MSFAPGVGIMLYVDDVLAELEFWQAVGFTIRNQGKEMDYDFFEMSPSEDSTVVFTVYDKTFIQQVSPEVAGMVPSVLFESKDIEALQEKVAAQTSTASEVHEQPFKNFNFASPSGIYFAVRGI